MRTENTGKKMQLKTRYGTVENDLCIHSNGLQFNEAEQLIRLTYLICLTKNNVLKLLLVYEKKIIENFHKPISMCFYSAFSKRMLV